MAVQELAVTFPSDLAARVLCEAQQSGESVCLWLAEAAADRLRQMAGEAAINDYEAEFGEITAGELARVREIWPA